jgi:hypothetical protein
LDILWLKPASYHIQFASFSPAKTGKVTTRGRPQKLKVRFVLTAILIICMYADRGFAQWAWASTQEAEDYSRAFLQSLVWAKVGRARITTTKLSDRQALASLMYDLKAANDDYRRGIGEIKRYTNSKNESVRVSAKGVRGALSGLVNQNEKLIALIRAADRNDSARSDPLARASDVVVKLNESWHRLITASIATAYVFMEPDPVSGAMRLNITETQKRRLLEELENIFGPQITEGLNAGLRSVEAAAASLYGFLKEPWPTKPE